MRNCSHRVSNLIGVLCIASIAVAGGHKQKEGTETVSEAKALSTDTVYEFSRSVGVGRIVKVQDGKAGSITRIYKLVMKDGKNVKELIREERIDPKPTIYHLGKGGWTPSRGKSFAKTRSISMKASAYDPGPHSNGKWSGKTTLGVRPAYGIAAVDPRHIPLGSLLFVEGYGFAYAADTGSAIKGNRIDLCFNSVAECYRFGRKTVKVHVLKAK